MKTISFILYEIESGKLQFSRAILYFTLKITELFKNFFKYLWFYLRYYLK